MTVYAVSIIVFLIIFLILYFYDLKAKKAQKSTKYFYLGIILCSLLVTAWVVIQSRNQWALVSLLLQIVAAVGGWKNIRRRK
ncbi:hypothetical protein [Paenibacillus aestuarii]|uniref:Uncharacterized protein n=1 Tax=Paenibacillus aestuarii TaxID=516965 RepID=A0ABW0K264_9BACL|nr:hypothetical protein [Paenibacillus aestuarii]